MFPILAGALAVAFVSLTPGRALAKDTDDDEAFEAAVATAAGRPVPAVEDSAGGIPAEELFRDADLAEGEALIAAKECTACHVRNVGGDGTAIYRPKGRINTPGFLRGMVEYCNTELNLQLFPEDVNAVAAVLNRDHYHFK